MGKWLVVYSFLFVMVSGIHAQRKYEIHKMGGSVEFVSSSQKLSKGMALDEKDRIRIGDQSFLSFVDRTSQKLYEYKSPGIHSVLEMVRFCTNEKRSITNGIVREIKNNIAKGDGKNVRSVGAVKRGDIDEKMMEQIYAFIAKHMNDTSSVGSQVAIKLVRKEDGLSLVLVNSTDKILYANVLSLANGLKPIFCFDTDSETPCLMLMPHSELDMLHVIMMDVGQKFLLVCADKEFDSEGIQFMMDEQLEPDDSIKEGCQCYSFILNVN